jgi:hypothetical protein
MGEDDRDADEVQHPEDYESLSDEETSRQGYSHGQAEQPEAALQQPAENSLRLAPQLGPPIAQDQGDSNQEHEEEGCEVAKY